MFYNPTIPQIKENNERFETENGKLQADITDVSVEAVSTGVKNIIKDNENNKKNNNDK